MLCVCHQLVVEHIQTANSQVCSSVLCALTMHCLRYTSVTVDILYVLSAGQRSRRVQHVDLQSVSSTAKHFMELSTSLERRRIFCVQ